MWFSEVTGEILEPEVAAELPLCFKVEFNAVGSEQEPIGVIEFGCVVVCAEQVIDFFAGFSV